MNVEIGDDKEPTPDPAYPPIQRVLKDVMAAVDPVGKDSENREQHFRFRGIDAILNEAAPELAKFGVIPIPRVVGEPRWEFVTTTKGKQSTACRLVVEYRFYGPAGDYLPAIVPGEAWDTGDKATSKAMSVAYRTALIQVLAIATGEPDPDEETYERGAPQGAREQTQQPPPQRTAGANAVASVAQKLGLGPQQVYEWFQRKYGYAYQQAKDDVLIDFASFMEDNPPGAAPGADSGEPPF